jgi:hypothetical protein
MGIWLKALLAGACVAVVAAAGTVIYAQASPSGAPTRLVASPQKTEACEKAVAEAVLYHADKDYPEKLGRFTAVRLTDSEDHGLLSPTQKAAVMKSKLAPYLKAYQADRAVWQK